MPNNGPGLANTDWNPYHESIQFPPPSQQVKPIIEISTKSYKLEHWFLSYYEIWPNVTVIITF